MPLVTAAVIAVGVAVATTTVATVSAAVIAVGTLVGTVGLGMSVIGMAIGNKTLTKIGGYLGMAGGVMSIGGALAGGMSGYTSALSQAWDDGVGSLFSSTKSVGQTPLGSVGNAAANTTSPVQPAATATPTSIPPSSPNLGPSPQLLPSPSSGASSAGVNPLDFAGTAKSGAVGPNIGATQFANMSPPSAPLSGAELSAVTTKANVGPGMGLEGLRQQALGEGIVKATQAGLSQSSSGGIGDFFTKLPDWAKAQVAISGAQGLAGMAGGWFESATAEEKLELERQAQQWRMQHEDRTQAFNQKNASYAPRVTFGSGVLNRGARS